MTEGLGGTCFIFMALGRRSAEAWPPGTKLGSTMTPNLPLGNLVTVLHDLPAGKESRAEWDSGVGCLGLVLAVQAEHEGLEGCVAEVKGQGEDTGGVLPRRVPWFFWPCSLPEPGVESPSRGESGRKDGGGTLL